MDAAQALAYIVARVAPDDDPVLSTDELVDLLPLAVTADSDGVAPDEDGWVPTYSIVGCYRAIAEGWLIKRGKAVGRFDFQTDGQLFRRSQTLDQIEHQRRYYARKVQASPSTLGASA